MQKEYLNAAAGSAVVSSVSDNKLPVPVSKVSPDVIECEAVPIGAPPRRTAPPERRPRNLLWLIPVGIVLFLLFKLIAIVAIAVLILFALPRFVPGGVKTMFRSMFTRGPK